MESKKNETPDFLLFDDIGFSDLMKDIYVTTKTKEIQIQNLVSQLQGLINSITDATIAVPLIKEYLEVSVRNDEQLVKLAAVIQRHVSSLARTSSAKGGDTLLLTEEEKLQLLEIAEQELKQLASPE
jgi:hypothetical protein